MPKITIITPGSATVGVNILKSGTNYTTVRDATAGTNAGNEDNKFTLNAKAGSNFFIRRGILLYDFTGAELPRNIKITRADLIMSDVNESAAQTNGNKITIGWIFDPNTFGSIHENDYNRARYKAAHYTSGQELANGADGEVVNLDNKLLLAQLEQAINNKTFLHLVARNLMDFANTTATGNNRVWFDRPNADHAPLRLRIYYSQQSERTHFGGSGTGRASTSGFGADSNLFSGTSSGFSL